MGHRDYLGLLGQMDVNLHLSFSESWGQLTAESLAMGVPCLIANHSDIYDYDPLLRERLVSPHFDDPLALAGDVARVIEERHALADRCRQYVGTLNRMADVLLKEFLEA
jgi:glycosyltransferase involved in cell wall biosynthesis